MCPDESPRVIAPLQGWRVPAFNWYGVAVLLLALLFAAYVGGCMVGREQERDQQQARQSACQADAHCLRP
ncbi:hypothetical protein GCM10027046_22380 [Uliginosibacterium flavum]|uniref:Uncharacterized protein n=1 Tax=Uliginosibacterium flavum TaxID=1396831 RepID=A0ABV2TLP6_9RHOO